MHLEACPDCQAERQMVQDSRASFKCGAVYQGYVRQTGCRPIPTVSESEPIGPKLTVAAIPLSEPEAYTLEVLEKIRTHCERKIEETIERLSQPRGCSCPGHNNEVSEVFAAVIIDGNRRELERATAAIEWVRGQIGA